VLSRQAAIEHLHSVLAVPATRIVRTIPSEVRLDREDGMPGPCALSLDNIVSMPKSLFVERICRLEVSKLHEVCLALAVATGCSPNGSPRS